MFRLLAFGPSITRNTITRILTLHHGDLCKAQRWNNTRFDLRSISPALPLTLSVSLIVFTRFKYCDLMGGRGLFETLGRQRIVFITVL